MISFIIGFLIGGILGFIITCLSIAAGKYNDEKGEDK
jgi:gas vesicle protein